uniref:Trypsin-like serine protease n=1 Tax=Coptotermes formosanus TaxID=36987 RepID=R4V4Q1_COPFO|nr:trypsin-like serine protease [Coptotermes formosanus]
MICAEGYIPESGTCLYDSGGPLVADGRLLGIVSWGYETCASGRPDVYTKISAVRDWIRDNSGV